ncbi:MAG: sugar transferase [Coriobacteriia bacterium]|nr:sugar transferase [Coriobacteriia bacterium]
MYSGFFKRLLDLLVSLVVLPLALLVLLVCAILIVIDDGRPVFYVANRMGKGGHPFKMYKLRSMYVNSPDYRMADGSTYNAADDPRMTRVGRKLRKSSLDELPQLFNVLLGDMSLIGPRPDDLKEAELYQGREALKLKVHPGITGLAQVSGRNAITWRQRLALDLEYAESVSFILDLRILFKTFAVVFGQKDVYVTDEGKEGADGAGNEESQ